MDPPVAAVGCGLCPHASPGVPLMDNAKAMVANNPFMLLMNPEVVLAAVERSEALAQLNRHMCRPLDKQLDGTLDSDSASNDDQAQTLAEGLSSAS